MTGDGNRTGRLAAVLLLATAAVAAVAAAPEAVAALCAPLPNGRFTAVSDGVWAKTNEVFRDEQTVTSTWTLSSWCDESHNCAGSVVSSDGWSAELTCAAAGQWSVRRQHPTWVPCPDGSTAAANQLYYFAPDLVGAPSYDAIRSYTGWDRTVGESGGCGVNLPVVIELPFTLKAID
ncbi:hypothetical protein MINS_41810 [Mycolicibacterium insubricum]|jgi:hypothetical protein|uniref:Uncharacterized protein n=1 Tax=Mycolicibacterium insubricum TaxID=444597 RepID=A0A1X0DFJ2_9MYCO|nr:hypothetical protein [Mycolicibacterium insubricum]ORA71176.1 hypothetical protein BST26_08760 [Mycolicibacterium insubricum]BBZ68752.1 hypothetical protein MINS_41810 [Mycolicibacterium insubricum]